MRNLQFLLFFITVPTAIVLVSVFMHSLKKGSLTERGYKWERKNSIWIIAAALPYVYGAAWIWAGARARRYHWAAIGMVLSLLPWVMHGVLDSFDARVDADNLVFRALYTVSFAHLGIIPAFSFANAFIMRKKYLIYRDIVLKGEPTRREHERQSIINQYYGGKNNKTGQVQARGLAQPERVRDKGLPDFLTGASSEDSPPVAYSSPEYKETPIVADEKTHKMEAAARMPKEETTITPIALPIEQGLQKMDLNRCTEQQLASLPGVGIVLAKKAVALRKEKGAFVSVEDFAASLGLASHFEAQIKEVCAVTPVEAAKASGRVLDI